MTYFNGFLLNNTINREASIGGTEITKNINITFKIIEKLNKFDLCIH